MSGPRFKATHGFSCYIEADVNVLFDVGPDDTFLYNAARLNLELQPNFIVLSHGHWDHGDGLSFMQTKANLVYHPACFKKRFSKVKNKFVGLSNTEEQAAEKFILQKSKNYIKLSEQVYFLGEIPRLNNFEAQHTDFIDENGKDDFIEDDSALAVILPKGLVVVSGCSHAGICNTIEYAKKITGVKKVQAVFGGFHLKSQGNQTQRTIDYFQKNEIKNVLPSHCTSLPALADFYNIFKMPQVLTGNYYSF
jgi:7,8-dihydropterin-6-yl-methyl-4-(beta-D-ribofuranosyl)aminobenzene 5'-phosphate synthase